MAAFASSYIKTEGSQVTRSGDAASMTGANFTSFYRQDEGVVYAEGSTNSTSLTPIIISIDAGSTANRIQIGRTNSANLAMRTFVTASGVEQTSAIGTQTTVLGEMAKLAFAYKVNDFIGAVNGVNTAADTLGVLPVVTQMQIGSQSGFSFLNGTIRKLSYYPARLSNTQLQALTG